MKKRRLFAQTLALVLCFALLCPLAAFAEDTNSAIPADPVSYAVIDPAELTRLVHVTFHPEDAYGSAEKMDIAIYGDFVYCTLSPAEGGAVTYRADCSLRELDSFLTACAATPAPSAAPTPDPYVAPSPTPTEAPAETPDAQ